MRHRLSRAVFSSMKPILLIPSDQPKSIGLRFGGPVGKWTEHPYDHLNFQAPDPTSSFEATYSNGHLSMLRQNPDPKFDGILHRENEAPWAKIEIQEMPPEKK